MFSFLRRPSVVRAAQRKHDFRPCLEALEDRCVPATHNVISSADSFDPGTLRHAIAIASTGDTIRIAPFVPSIQLVLGELKVEKDLTIEGISIPAPAVAHGPFSPTTISGNFTSRVFEITSGAHVTLRNLVFTGGTGVADPEGPRVIGEGGAIFNSGELHIANSRLSGNRAHLGGGIFNEPGGTVWVQGSSLSGNTALAGWFPPPVSSSGPPRPIFAPSFGGGIYNLGELHVVDGSELSGNAATYGAGIFNEVGATVEISASTLSGNTADYGGGVYNRGTVAILDHSTLTGNTALLGGGFYNDVGGTVTIGGSGLFYNTASLGGDLYNAGVVNLVGINLIGDRYDA
jgi:hypothetical protein